MVHMRVMAKPDVAEDRVNLKEVRDKLDRT